MRRLLGALLAVLVPILATVTALAGNVATGGALPAPLAPYRAYTWHLVIALTALTAIVALIVYTTQSTQTTIVVREIVGFFVTANREKARGRARDRWESRRGATQRYLAPVNWSIRYPDGKVTGLPDVAAPDDVPAAIATEMSIASGLATLYRASDGALLVLGNAGLGKTTVLVELAKLLLAASETDASQPVPLYLNLADYKPGKSDSTAWFVHQISEICRVSRGAARDWLRRGDVVLLLDALDEVRKPGDSAQCAQAITRLQHEYGPLRMVVSCLSNVYERLPALPLQRCVELQEMTPAQIEECLARSEVDRAALRTALAEHPGLADVLNTPLMLQLAVAALWNAEDTKDSVTSLLTPARLFDAYLAARLAKNAGPAPYRADQVVRWLRQLARGQNGYSYIYDSWWDRWTYLCSAESLSTGSAMVLVALPAACLAFVVATVLTALAPLLSGAMIAIAIMLTLAIVVALVHFAEIGEEGEWLHRPAPQAERDSLPRQAAALGGGLVVGCTGGVLTGFVSHRIGLALDLFDAWPARLLNAAALAPLAAIAVGGLLLVIRANLAGFGALLAAPAAFVASLWWIVPGRAVSVAYVVGFAVALGFVVLLRSVTLATENRAADAPPYQPWRWWQLYIGLGVATVPAFWLVHTGQWRGELAMMGALALGIGYGLLISYVFEDMMAEPLSVALNRLVLTYRGDLPWRLRQFLEFLVIRGLLTRDQDSYVFFHRLWLNHLADQPDEPVPPAVTTAAPSPALASGEHRLD